jgi:phage protein D
METLDHIYMKVLYNGKNITADLSKSLMSFNYTDNMSEADTLDISVEDSDCKWQSEWYPQKGAKITAEIGILGGEVLDCGTFEIDEIEFTGIPDSVNIRCIAAGFKQGQKRTLKSHVHEKKTLSEIVHTIAADLGLKVIGNVSQVKVDRLVQQKKGNLTMLKKLAARYGCTFNVRDQNLIFIKNEDLEGKQAVEYFDKTDLISFSLTDRTFGTYSSASIKFHNPTAGSVIEYNTSEGGLPNSDDVLHLDYSVDSMEQAQQMTKSALREANKMQQSGNISLPGSAILISGNVISLLRLGRLSGDYLIKSASHTISSTSGWLADLEVYKVGFKEETEKQTEKNTTKKKKKEKKKKEEESLNFNFKGDY